MVEPALEHSEWCRGRGSDPIQISVRLDLDVPKMHPDPDLYAREMLVAIAKDEALKRLASVKIRIGMHLGDVQVEPDGNLMGHGVNVADSTSALVSRTRRQPDF